MTAIEQRDGSCLVYRRHEVPGHVVERIKGEVRQCGGKWTACGVRREDDLPVVFVEIDGEWDTIREAIEALR